MTDNKNTILAIVLSALVLLGWQFFFAVPQEKARQEQLHRFLSEAVQHLPSVSSVAIYGKRGNLLASSNAFPVGLQSIDDVDFLAAQRKDGIPTTSTSTRSTRLSPGSHHATWRPHWASCLAS